MKKLFEQLEEMVKREETALDPITFDAAQSAIAVLCPGMATEYIPHATFMYAGHRFERVEGGARIICEETERAYAEAEVAA